MDTVERLTKGAIVLFIVVVVVVVVAWGIDMMDGSPGPVAQFINRLFAP